MTNYQRNLAEGVAQWLEDESVGTWKPAGIYTASETGIILRTLPSSPDRVIVLSTYAVADDPSLSDSVTGLQVITRWGGADPRLTDDLTDLVFDALHGAHGIDLVSGIRVVQALHRSGTSLGQDTNLRWRTASNYYLTCHRSSPNRS